MARLQITIGVWDSGGSAVKSIQGEASSRILEITFLDKSGAAINLTGSTPRMYVNDQFVDGTILDATGGKAEFPVTSGMLSKPGSWPIEFLLSGPDYPPLKANGLALRVDASHVENAVESDDKYSSLVIALNRADAAADKAEQAKTDSEAAIVNANTAIGSIDTKNQEITAAESSRVTAENGRVSAENTRKTNETARKAAETDRATAESERASAENARESQESARVGAESSRASAESARASAENTRKTNEDARKSAETSRASAESSRKTAETGRVNAESDRADAESARADAESTRQSNEQTRKTAETTRQTQEGTRQTQESTRQTNEDARQDAESARATAETVRVSAENARKSNETARQTAETTRSGNEDARKTAENTRKQNETDRQTSESARAAAETARQQQETTRQTQETGRVNAESARVTAENKRQTDTQTAISGANTARDGANTAADRANTAAQNAEDAISGQLDPAIDARIGAQKDQPGGIAGYDKTVSGITLSGNPVTASGVLCDCISSCVVHGKTWQDGTGDPSPDNVRLIHGAKGSVQGCGKNLLQNTGDFKDLSYWDLGKAPNAAASLEIVFDQTKGNVLHANCSAVGNYVLVINKFYAYFPNPFDTTKQYTLSFDIRGNASKSILLQLGDTDGTHAVFYRYVTTSQEWTHNSYTFTPSQKGHTPNLYFSFFNTGDLYITNVKLEIGPETPYSPYRGTTATPPQELFNDDWWDAVSGLGQIKNIILELDGTESYSLYWNGKRDTQIANGRIDVALNVNLLPCSTSDATCDHFKYDQTVSNGSGLSTGFGIFYAAPNQRIIFSIPISTIGATAGSTDAEFLSHFKSYFSAQKAAGTPVTFVYKSTTPTPITGTPTQFLNPAGELTVSQADGASLDVTISGAASTAGLDAVDAKKADKTDIPTSLPANGGTAAKVSNALSISQGYGGQTGTYDGSAAKSISVPKITISDAEPTDTLTDGELWGVYSTS